MRIIVSHCVAVGNVEVQRYLDRPDSGEMLGVSLSLGIQIDAEVLHKFRYKILHMSTSSIHRFENFLMARLIPVVPGAQTPVGDEREAENGKATVGGHDDLKHGAHTHSITADSAHQLNLVRGLIRRARHTTVCARAERMLEGNLGCGFVQQLAKALVVYRADGREARTEPSVVRSSERVATSKAHEGNMVLDDHHVADIVFRVDTSSGVCNNKHADTKGSHDSHGHTDDRGVVSFVEMEAAFHADYFLALDFSENELAGMSVYGRAREHWDVGVFDDLPRVISV